MAVTESGQLAGRELDVLYRTYGPDIYRYAFAVLGNRADAEDVTQTTFLNAYRALEQGVEPRKPANWLLTIASNLIKQRFRQEHTRPREVELDRELAGRVDDDLGPTVGELMTALARIPPQQRQALVLREFEGRTYHEIADMLGITTSALETLLFRARRSLAEKLEQHLTCTEAQEAVSRAVDERLGRKERRRLREHLNECPDCAHFARAQPRHRKALRGLLLVPVPLSLSLFRGLDSSAAAATLPASGAGAGASTAMLAGSGAGAASATGAGVFAGGVTVKAAAVVAAASVAGGVGVVGAAEVDTRKNEPAARVEKPGQRLGQVAPRGVSVPGNGVARGKVDAPGQTKPTGERATGKAIGKSPSEPSRKRQADRPTNRGSNSASSQNPTRTKRAHPPKGKKSQFAPGQVDKASNPATTRVPGSERPAPTRAPAAEQPATGVPGAEQAAQPGSKVEPKVDNSSKAK